MTASNEADTTKTIIILLILSLVLSKAALMSSLNEVCNTFGSEFNIVFRLSSFIGSLMPDFT